MAAKVYIVAGEVSGDVHGAEFMESLLQRHPHLAFYGVGGPRMHTVAARVTDWVEDAAVMGIWEVLKQYGWFKKRFNEMLEEVLMLQPEVLFLIDYPGFNLRFATAVREKAPNVKIVQYVCPQVWAWNKKRVPKMAKALDLLLCILPFEKKIFENAGLRTEFVGHPLVDELPGKLINVERRPDLVGLFPGSREREVSRLLPTMIDAAKRVSIDSPETNFEISAASEKLAKIIEGELKRGDKDGDLNVKIVIGESHRLMQEARCGIVASGTATVEASWFGLPYCLVYRVAPLTFATAKVLVKIRFIGLINILAERQVIEEFIQGDVDPGSLARSVNGFLSDEESCVLIKSEMQSVLEQLGEPGVHERVAGYVSEFIEVEDV